MRQLKIMCEWNKINEFDLGRGNPKNQRNFIPVLVLV